MGPDNLGKTLVLSSLPLVLDGGLATELERRGHDLRDALWSARLLRDDPAAIEEVHLDYLRAGARCLTTASYQASLEGFAAQGESSEGAERLLRRSVILAERARARFREETGPARGGGDVLVAASVGPYGATRHDGSEYHGNYGLSHEDMVAFHTPRLRILWDAGPDLLACETIPSLEEARALLAVLRLVPGTKGWMSFSCRDERHTVHGEAIRECARLLDRASQIVAIGVNCTPPGLIASLIREIRLETTKPIVVYPNSGERWDAEAQCWRGAPDGRKLEDYVDEWVANGASLIGGCCRIGPADIRGISARLTGKR